MIAIEFTEDPREALSQAEAYLQTEPIRCNLILSILRMRIDTPKEGRYWIVRDDGQAIGVVIHSPLEFAASLSPMGRVAAMTAADAIASQGFSLSGIGGEPASAAAFAGQWAARRKVGASPGAYGRIYELTIPDSQHPIKCDGKMRNATQDDRDLLIEWLREFQATADVPPSDPGQVVDLSIRQQTARLWEDGESKSWASYRPSPDGIARIGPVYTPPAFRGTGYATALVDALSRELREHGNRCMLYTDLANPTSNSIYQRIGYRPISEYVRFLFGK